MNGQELIKLKLPALFISRPFQVGNLAPILSISGCMSAPLDAVGEAFRILSSKKKASEYSASHNQKNIQEEEIVQHR